MNSFGGKTRRGVAIFACCLLPLFSSPTQAERIKDLASVQGVRNNQLVGYGLVVGLDGTGDQTTQTPFTTQSIINMLAQLGTTLPTTQSLALGPAGDPLTMAARRDPRIDRLLSVPAATAPDEWATIPGDVPWEGPGTFQVAEITAKPKSCRKALAGTLRLNVL